MLDLVGLLQSEKEAFTRSERALTEIVLADVDSVLKMSIVDLASQADVSPPTVTRFCRRLGCDSYADFKVRLAQSRFVGQRYLAPTTGPSSVREIAQGVVNGIQSTIYETFERLDLDAIERAADALGHASFVLTFGSGGSSSMMATEAEARLFRLGLKVSSSTDHQVQMMRAAAAPVGSVVMAFSLSGNNLPMAKALDVAGEYGAKTRTSFGPRRAVTPFSPRSTFSRKPSPPALAPAPSPACGASSTSLSSIATAKTASRWGISLAFGRHPPLLRHHPA